MSESGAAQAAPDMPGRFRQRMLPRRNRLITPSRMTAPTSETRNEVSVTVSLMSPRLKIRPPRKANNSAVSKPVALRTNDPANPIYDFEFSVARMRAAREAIDKAGGDVLLVGRAEGLIRNRPDFDDILRRLIAFANAGADCLYAPGVKTAEQITAVIEGVAPKPVNVLMGGPSPLTVKRLADLGVRRISVGGALARSAWGGFMRAALAIAEHGSFDGFADAAPSAELNKLFMPQSK